MAAEILVLLVVEVVGGLIAETGLQAATAKGREWLDRRDLEKLDDDAKQAFIAGLVFVASYDGALSEAELEEVEGRLKRLEVAEEQVKLALAAREEVAQIIGGDEATFAQKLVARIPEGRTREALVRVGIAVALKGDADRQLQAVRLLGKAMGLEDSEIEATVVSERQRLFR